MRIEKQIIYGLFILGACCLIYCNTNSNAGIPNHTYLNLQDSIKYIGMETCRSCHSNVHHTFKETGMGQSFGKATLTKSGATFEEHDIVYDKKSNFYYKPFFQNDTMYVKEYRLDGKDTIHSRIEKIDYIVGSGHHTNSHLINENGYFFQAPITYYTQDKRWDMAPGFEKENQRFSRFLTPECITCHNHYPLAIAESLNKYQEMPTGIECERCHGPGEIHVKEKLAGNIVDTSKHIDYTIINPSDLPRDLQMDLCQRCHLQGLAVLEEGKSFFDFKPGMKLSEVMNVFLPRYTDSHEQFIMASQADRLRLSKCYTESTDLTCLSCHNPHQSVRGADKQVFNEVCKDCHSTKKLDNCSAPLADREAQNNNCVKCHMPPSSSIDIPHIKITDHYISRITDFDERQISEGQKSEIAQFLGLKILTKDQATNLEMAKGYLAMFDKNVQADAILDSTYYYLNKSTAAEADKFNTWIHYYFSKESYRAIVDMAKNRPPTTIADAWTAYRIGESFFKLGAFPQSILYYKKATQYSTYNLDFQEKLGAAYLAQNSIPQAKQVYEFVLKENPKRAGALNGLGYLHIILNQLEQGESFYDKALALNPDHLQALLNKSTVRLFHKDKKSARALLKRVLEIDPEHAKALELMESL